MPNARSATKMIAADAQPPRTALRSWRALPSPKAAAKASHRGASRHCVDQNVKSCNLFGGIAQMEHMVQLGALRWVPARAGVPRTGHGEAPVQHPKPNSRANSRNPPFSPGGGRGSARAPPRRRRRAALGPMPYGNRDITFPMTAWAVVRLVWPSGSRSAAGGRIVGSRDAIRE